MKMMTTDMDLIDLNDTTTTIKPRRSKQRRSSARCQLLSTFVLDCTGVTHCEPNGYCNDDIQDLKICLCKFWWTGTYCDQRKCTRITTASSDIQSSIRTVSHVLVSNGGRQIIALAVILFIFMLLFHCRPLFLYIRRRGKPSPAPEPK